MIITSKDNNKIKYIRKLRNNKYMNEEKKFVVEGEHLVKEALLANILIETFSTNDTSYGVTNNLISSDVMESISNLPSKTDVIGICKYKKENEVLGDKLIILDNVQDPGNLGTIIRSANAFGINSVILSKTSVNKYNEKVIRATQGMLFKINVITRDLEEFIPSIIKEGYMVYGTNVVKGINIKDIDKKGKIAIIMGSEGTGISNEIKEIIHNNIYIDMKDDCESLNVAVAASIIMYEIGSGK